MKLPGYPMRWLLGCVALFVATPFLAFPEIMGDVGPRNIPLWRDLAGIALLGMSGMGAMVSFKWWLRERRRAAKSADLA
jgi:drug/metabolite transporter (DMT)-like permease